MIKQVVYLVLISLAVVLMATYLDKAFLYLIHTYNVLNSWFSNIFASTKLGLILTQLCSLFLLPFIAAMVIAGGYWMFKRKQFPYLVQTMWVLWLILATMLVVSR